MDPMGLYLPQKKTSGDEEDVTSFRVLFNVFFSELMVETAQKYGECIYKVGPYKL